MGRGKRRETRHLGVGLPHAPLIARALPQAPSSPFSFGALALGESFTDRSAELKELRADMRNGQDVLLYAPRRYGKSSLVLKAAAESARIDKVLVGYVDLMKTPNKEKLAAALAKTIYDDLDNSAEAFEQKTTRLFSGLRLRPTMALDPADGSLQFSFRASRRQEDIDDTIQTLLELPGKIAQKRKRGVVLIFDEFQEIITLDKRLPNVMRAVFQTQPTVGHVYLGSKRHVLESIFSDRNEPFWRSAKQMELGPIPKPEFSKFLKARFQESERDIDPEALARLLEASGGHPYGTQELAYFAWELVPQGFPTHVKDVEQALDRVLKSEHNHLSKLWEDASHNQRLLMLALAEEPTKGLYAADYRDHHHLPTKGSIPTALRYLEREEIAGRDEQSRYVIIEPFFAEWLRREQRDYGRPRV
jgi:hypothetical protein